MKLTTRSLRLAISGAMVTGMGFAMIGAPTAHALTTDQKCPKTAGVVLISPGLTTTNQSETFTIKGHTSGCTAPHKAYGTLKGRFTVTASCTNFPNPFTTKIAVKWFNAKGGTNTANSTLKATFNVNTSTLTANVSGKVTAGAFVNDSIKNSQQYTLESGNCTAASPVTKISFKQTSAFLFRH